MTIIPNQYFGLGDIIFTQTLARIIADGRPMIWPVLPQFVDGLNRAYPDITFVDWRTLKIDYERKEQYECDVAVIGRCTVLPFRWADQLMKVPYSECMRSKYAMYGLDFNIWKEQAMWKRDQGMEKHLWQHLDGNMSNFKIINNTFGSDSQLKISIPVQGIHMSTCGSFGKNYSLFDWAWMIENATEIHTVSTSIIYLLEMLDLKAKEVHLYPRKPIEQDFRNIDYILQRHKYILHS